MEEVIIHVEALEHHEGLPLPQYTTPHSSGMDLHAAVEETIAIPPGQRALIPTGLRMALPEGLEGQVRPRSGLALRHGVTLLNTPGTIDSDYRGEIKVLLVNLGDKPFRVARGDRIAQLVIQRVVRGSLRLQAKLEETERNTGGFGHTGV